MWENIFDTEDFKIHTKCDFEEEVVQWFWEWFENCKEEDKFKYLKFVSGRSRLPKKDYTHTIIFSNCLQFNSFKIFFPIPEYSPSLIYLI